MSYVGGVVLYRRAKFQVENQVHLEEIKKRNMQMNSVKTEGPLFMLILFFSLLPNAIES